MGRRLQVFVMVVVIAFLGDPAGAMDPPQSYFELMDLLASRCQSDGWEEAATDLANLLPYMVNCVDFHQLYDDALQHMEKGDVKGFLRKTCRDKGNLLFCIRRGLLKVERCLRPQERNLFDQEKRFMENIVHFICRNNDDIALLFDSVETNNCTVYAAESVENCTTQKPELSAFDKHFETFDEYLNVTEGLCPMLEEILQCYELTGRCQDALFIRIVNSFIEEVVMDGLCRPKKLSTSGASSLQAFIDVLSGILGHLVLGLAVPHVLHLH